MSNTANDETSKVQAMNRNDRSANRKLRSGMIKRLCADPFIRKLLPNQEDTNALSDDILLCEALIQQNNKKIYNSANTKCEERVNVNSESVEGIRKAILSHWEDNLDVLEVLLNMPYLPKGRLSDGEIKGKQEIINSLSGRAFLRLLEDAMFDACEKEGEDELLDDLNVSDREEGGAPDEDRKLHCRMKKIRLPSDDKDRIG